MESIITIGASLIQQVFDFAEGASSGTGNLTSLTA
jgi:hypothetical protein